MNISSSMNINRIHNRKFNELSLFEGTIAFGLDGAVVDENVRGAFTLDKSVAFRVVEPFDLALFAFAHDVSLRSVAPGGVVTTGGQCVRDRKTCRRIRMHAGARPYNAVESAFAVPVDNYTSGKRKKKEAEMEKKRKKRKKTEKKRF